jgi:multimeric flavodoxin WrbA
MKVTMLNGLPEGQDDGKALSGEFEAYFAHHGATVTHFHLADEPVRCCLGCFHCWTTSPGECRIDDPARLVAQAVIASDWTVFLTPVTFGGYSSQLKKAVDRLIPLILPFFRLVEGEFHHQPRYQRYPNILGIGILGEPDPTQEAIFRQLVERNAINLQAPGHASVFVHVGESRETVWSDLDEILMVTERKAA